MKVGFHVEPLGQFGNHLLKFEQILDHNNIDHIRMDSNDPDFWDQLKEVDCFIYKWVQYDTSRQRALSIIPVIEKEFHTKCFPDNITSWHFDDKVRQYYLMKSKGFPMTESYIFWDENKAMEWAETAELPVIYKLKGGAGSRNVQKIRQKKELKRLIKANFGPGVKDGFVPGYHTFLEKTIKKLKRWAYIKSSAIKGVELPYRFYQPNWNKHKGYIYFQKFNAGNTFDTRITTIGDRAFAFRRINRPNDFRASGSGNINYELDKIDMRCVKKALEVSKHFGFQTMTYDFLFTENNEIEFCEISYNYNDRAVYNCAGYWDEELNWHEGHFWPQFTVLKDLLGKEDLKQPDLL
jgi:hypothetical protein